jgi:cytochrome c biogenesis protein CcmG, thiol:disulfide interchange protein DsbE
VPIPSVTQPAPTQRRSGRSPRRALLRAALALGATSVSSVALGCGATGLPPSAPSPLLGKPLPEITRRALDQSAIDTKSNRGSVVVVKFFAKYCEPCKKTLPLVERLHQSRSKVVFIGVDEDEYASEAEEMVRTFGLTFPVVHDTGTALAGRYRVGELPMTFVVDGTGTIRWVGGEKQSDDDLERALDAVQP